MEGVRSVAGDAGMSWKICRQERLSICFPSRDIDVATVVVLIGNIHFIMERGGAIHFYLV